MENLVPFTSIDLGKITSHRSGEIKFGEKMLTIPKNYTVTIINSGCCGMAGSFGYEKEHYEISMQMGEDTLFPKVRNTAENVKIAAAGTSCRHQIYDGTKREAQHPVSILRSCLK